MKIDKKRVVFFAVIFLITVIFPFASASVLLGNSSSSIETSYSPGDKLKGWVNLSFQNEDSNKLLTSNFPGSISLKDFLNANSVPYNCIPTDCQNDYLFNNPETSKNFNLSTNGEKLFSFVINGRIQGINELSFNVSVDNQMSCVNPLEIDLFNDGTLNWRSKIIGNNFICTYNQGTGCYDASLPSSEKLISKTPYCEKIQITNSEKFKLGAWIRAGESGNSDSLKMILYDLDAAQLASCILPEPSPVGGEIDCNVTYSNKKVQEVYVCIKAQNLETTKYLIRKENPDVNPCGFYSSSIAGQQAEYHDYYIYAKAAMFENIGTFAFNQDEYSRQGNGNLLQDVKNYITTRYNNNCSNGCSIPIKFKAYENLNVNLSSLKLSYSTTEGLNPPETMIYDTSMKPAKISSDFSKLDLSLINISVPAQYGNYNFSLYFPNEILKQAIEIAKVPIINEVTPFIVPAGNPIVFNVDVTSPANTSIVKYTWDFYNNNTKLITTTNSILFTYQQVGVYNLMIEAQDETGLKSSKIFMITVGSPKEIVNSTLIDYRRRLDNVTKQIEAMPEWHKRIIENKINIDGLVSGLNNLEAKYDSASSDDDYILIMDNLAAMEVPSSVQESSSGEAPYFVDYTKINPSYFSQMDAGDFNDSDTETYQKAITAWTQKYLDMNLSFIYISAYYDSGVETLASVFDFKIIPKEASDEEIYVIIGNSNVTFSDNSLRTTQFSDATGIKFLDNSFREINFAMPGEVDFKTFTASISPKFMKLSIEGPPVPCNFNGICEKDLGENWRNCRPDCKPWGWLSFWWVIVIILAIIAYIFMQLWYQRRYENYLFKKRNDLFNIITFIKNSRMQGMKEKDISSSLRKVGWSGEQVTYAFKKIQGKALLPLDFLKLFKKLEHRNL